MGCSQANSSLFEAVVVQGHLRAFNVTPAYDVSASPPALQRVVAADALSISVVQRSGVFLLWIRLNLTLGSIQ